MHKNKTKRSVLISGTADKSDIVGAFASGLCILHCLAAPFLFVIQSCTIGQGCCASGPTWWSLLDFLFIGIAFYAVYHSSKHSRKMWMKYSLYTSWFILSLLMMNEKFGFINIEHIYKYLVACSMIVLHLINLKYFQNDKQLCCAGQ